MPCRMFSSIPALHPLNTPPSVTKMISGGRRLFPCREPVRWRGDLDTDSNAVCWGFKSPLFLQPVSLPVSRSWCLHHHPQPGHPRTGLFGAGGGTLCRWPHRVAAHTREDSRSPRLHWESKRTFRWSLPVVFTVGLKRGQSSRAGGRPWTCAEICPRAGWRGQKGACFLAGAPSPLGCRSIRWERPGAQLVVGWHFQHPNGPGG